MAFNLVPFEEDGNVLRRWWRTTLRPFSSPRTMWDEVYRGDSLLAPLGFAYLWILAACPLILLVGKLALMAIKATMGPYVAMSLANTFQVAPGTLASFLVSPLVLMFLGGGIAHGVLWIMDEGVRGRSRGTLRVLGYGCAWLLPWASALTAWKLYLQINPLAAIREGAGLGMGLISAPSPALLGFQIAQLVVGVTTLVLLIWGLASLHRSAWWKAILAALIALAVVWVVDQVLTVASNLGFVQAVLASRESRRQEEGLPKARIRRLIKAVERLQEETQTAFRRVGLPAPPRAVDLLTGGDWGAAIDLKQASESGFAPSCQVIYVQTLSALKGQVVHYSACLGEGPRMAFRMEPAPLLPAGSDTAARQIRQNLTAEQRNALSRARGAFSDAILFVEAEIGPFEAATPQAAQPHPEASGVQAQPPAPPPALPPPPPDPNTPSRHISNRLPMAEVRQMAVNGHPGGMNELGRRLFFGQNEYGKEVIPINKTEGVRWLSKAYVGGFRSAESCACLMMAYSTGQGAPVDPSLANQWRDRSDQIRAAERHRDSQGQLPGR